MTGGRGKDTFSVGHGGDIDMITDFRDFGDEVVFVNTIDSLGIDRVGKLTEDLRR